MREHAKDIQNKGAAIVAVIPADAAHIKGFLHVYGPYPFPIVGDPKLLVYKDMKLKRMSMVKSAKLIYRYLFSGRVGEIFPRDKEQMKIVKQAMTNQDVYQLGGAWLMDTTGEILWEHIDSEPSDHATIPTILAALAEFLSGK